MTTTWKISQLDREVSNGFVTTAHWIASVSEGVGKEQISVSIINTCSWSEGTPTIPYANLTEATVLNWVWESVDKTATESALAAQIALLKNPVKATGTPWGQA